MAMSPFRLRIAQRMQFYLERQFVRGASVQLLAVAALIGLISLVGGVLVLPVWGEGGNLGEAVWWAFLRLSDPGYLGDDQGAWRRVVSTWLTVAGYVVFLGALVAIMTQWLNARMRQLESGLTPVATRNHIVVLGWSNRTLPVVGEILQSEGRVKRFLAHLHTSRLRLVVLSQEVTRWHAQTLRDDPAIGKRSRDIVLRSGTPLVVDDLERVDCLNAAAVIVPSGGTGVGGLASDMATVKALLSLSSQRAAAADLPYVVAELQDQRKLTVARRAYRGPLEIVAGNSLISRLMAQNLRHRGLSRVYGELLSHRVGCGIYVREAGALAGSRFGALAGRFERAVLCGVVHWRDDGFHPALNPAADYVLEAGDRLVFVAALYEDTVPPSGRGASPETDSTGPDPRAAAADRAGGEATDRPPSGNAPPGVAVHPGRSYRILVLGWNARVAALLGELETYRDERFEVTVVSLVREETRRSVLDEVGPLSRVSCSHVEADYVLEANLRDLQPADYDNVLLASSERVASGEEADTRAVVAYLLLEELLDGAVEGPQLLLELQDPDNEPLIGGRRAEVMVSPLILAHIVAQVALRRELRAVYDDLFMAGGAELTLRTPARYGVPGGAHRFRDLAEHLRNQGDTLLGIYRPASDELLLSPPGSGALELGASDELVVMTTYD